MKRIKVTYKVNDFDEVPQAAHDEYVDSFGILAKGLWVDHYGRVEFHDNWYSAFFEVTDDRVTSVLDLINGLTHFEAEVVQ